MLLTAFIFFASASAGESQKSDLQSYVDRKVLTPMCDAGDRKACQLIEGIRGKKSSLNEGVQRVALTCGKSKSVKCRLLQGASEVAQSNFAPAQKPFDETCARGDRSGCVMSGLLKSKAERWKEASAFLRKACDAGEQEGCYHLGMAENHPNESPESRGLFEKSCEAGIARACGQRAQLALRSGNPPGARFFFKKACEKGDEPSCESLKKLDEGSK